MEVLRTFSRFLRCSLFVFRAVETESGFVGINVEVMVLHVKSLRCGWNKSVLGVSICMGDYGKRESERAQVIMLTRAEMLNEYDHLFKCKC